MSGGNSRVPEMGGGNPRVHGAFPPKKNACGTATYSETNEKPPIIRGRCGGNSLVSEMGGGNPLVYEAFSSPKRMRNRHSFENE